VPLTRAVLETRTGYRVRVYCTGLLCTGILSYVLLIRVRIRSNVPVYALLYVCRVYSPKRVKVYAEMYGTAESRLNDPGPTETHKDPKKEHPSQSAASTRFPRSTLTYLYILMRSETQYTNNT